MSSHGSRSGLPHNAIMIFPQGVFSDEAIVELKHANFLAVINTEVKSSAGMANQKPVRIADVWETAIMRYGDFPIYSRRYPRQGVENQAFDLLLGKPCFIVIHHDHCVNRCDNLVTFIDRINALHCRLSWRSPEEIVKRSYRQRAADDGAMEIQMYGSEILLENHGTAPQRFRVRKQERDASAVEELLIGTTPITPEFADGFVCFDVELAPAENASVRLRFRERPPADANGHASRSAIKILLRRYISELRDCYLPRRNLADRLYPVERASH